MTPSLEVTLKKFKETGDKLIKNFELYNGQKTCVLCGTDPEAQYKWLLKLIEQARLEQAEDICKLIDDLELKLGNTSMEEWKMFKRIRNSIRDKYVISTKEGGKG